MSEAVIYLIPTDPEYVPEALGQRQAVAYLESLLLPNPDPASEITANVNEHIEFLDPGENLERVLCPFCSSELASEWMGEAMNKAYKVHFADLRIITPCCHTETSLNDLQYEWPAGFARFVLKMKEPFSRDFFGVWQELDLTEDMLQKVQHMLGCRLRVIWAHY